MDGDLPGGHAATHRWLADTWDAVRPWLPPAPARVVDLGCGPHGGLVPALTEAGYAAVGVDPDAPAGDSYRAARFEDLALDAPVDAILASTSLHHVDGLDAVLELVAAALVPGGVLVAVEWAVERFDERTARWCFGHLPDASEDDGGWLRAHRDRWAASGRPWDEHLRAWVAEERLHTGAAMVEVLRGRFAERDYVETPYFFADLGLPKAEEQAAIDAGRIAATGFRFVGTPHA